MELLGIELAQPAWLLPAGPFVPFGGACRQQVGARREAGQPVSPLGIAGGDTGNRGIPLFFGKHPDSLQRLHSLEVSNPPSNGPCPLQHKVDSGELPALLHGYGSRVLAMGALRMVGGNVSLVPSPGGNEEFSGGQSREEIAPVFPGRGGDPMNGRLGPDGCLGQGDLALVLHPAGNRAAHCERQVQDDERIESGDVKEAAGFRIPRSAILPGEVVGIGDFDLDPVAPSQQVQEIAAPPVGQSLSRRLPLVLRQGPDDGSGNAFSGVGVGDPAGNLGCPDRRRQDQADDQESCRSESVHRRAEIPH